jgi:hypothetical protein
MALRPGLYSYGLVNSQFHSILPRLSCQGNETNIWECDYDTGYIAYDNCWGRYSTNYASVSCYNDEKEPSEFVNNNANYINVSFINPALCKFTWSPQEKR